MMHLAGRDGQERSGHRMGVWGAAQAVAFGLGGIFTEVLSDVALRVAPVDHAMAGEMIGSLRGYGILAGARGRKPVDLAALADIIVRVSELPFAYPEIAEIDLNPVFASPAGALAGDVRIITRQPAKAS